MKQPVSGTAESWQKYSTHGYKKRYYSLTIDAKKVDVVYNNFKVSNIKRYTFQP